MTDNLPSPSPTAPNNAATTAATVTGNPKETASSSVELGSSSYGNVAKDVSLAPEAKGKKRKREELSEDGSHYLDSTLDEIIFKNSYQDEKNFKNFPRNPTEAPYSKGSKNKDKDLFRQLKEANMGLTKKLENANFSNQAKDKEIHLLKEDLYELETKLRAYDNELKNARSTSKTKSRYIQQQNNLFRRVWHLIQSTLESHSQNPAVTETLKILLGFLQTETRKLNPHFFIESPEEELNSNVKGFDEDYRKEKGSSTSSLPRVDDASFSQTLKNLLEVPKHNSGNPSSVPPVIQNLQTTLPLNWDYYYNTTALLWKQNLQRIMGSNINQKANDALLMNFLSNNLSNIPKFNDKFNQLNQNIEVNPLQTNLINQLQQIQLQQPLFDIYSNTQHVSNEKRDQNILFEIAKEPNSQYSTNSKPPSEKHNEKIPVKNEKIEHHKEKEKERDKEKEKEREKEREKETEKDKEKDKGGKGKEKEKAKKEKKHSSRSNKQSKKHKKTKSSSTNQPQELKSRYFQSYEPYSTPCLYWERGHCKYGENCRFLHN